MKKKNFLILFTIIFLSESIALAMANDLTLKNLDHEIILKKGPKDKCTSEVIRFIAAKNVLFFDANLSFSFDAPVQAEKEEGQCFYKDELKITDREYSLKTTRSSCPKSTENGVLIESIRLQTISNEEIVVYQNSFKDKSFECVYSLKSKQVTEKK